MRDETLRQAVALSGELIACMRVNHLRGTFAEATYRDLDEFLAPYVERLECIKRDAKAAEQRRKDGLKE